jgi:uncharacterized protein YndB with AHSA1/START domain
LNAGKYYLLKIKTIEMPNIHHALLIGATPEKVYHAISSKEGISGWWTPGTNAKPEINSIVRIPFGSDYFKEMKIIELKPAQLVKWTCIHGVHEWVGTNLSFYLEPGDKRALQDSHPEVQDQIEQQEKDDKITLLTFHQDNWREYTPMYAECNYTWGQFLRSLKLFCETGKGTPWPNQHKN